MMYRRAAEYLEDQLGYSTRGPLHRAMTLASIGNQAPASIDFTSCDTLRVEYADGDYRFFHNGVEIDVRRAAELVPSDFN